MKILIVAFALVSVVGVQAQTVANTHNVLHPIMKDGKRKAISSVDRDPSLASEFRDTPSPAAPGYAMPAVRPGAEAKASEIVAKISPGLTASKISVLGTVNGLRGKFSVSNTGSATVTPFVELAVINDKGFVIGSATRIGQPLGPNASENFDLLETNTSGVDLKLLQLSPSHPGY